MGSGTKRENKKSNAKMLIKAKKTNYFPYISTNIVETKHVLNQSKAQAQLSIPLIVVRTQKRARTIEKSSADESYDAHSRQ